MIRLYEQGAWAIVDISQAYPAELSVLHGCLIVDGAGEHPWMDREGRVSYLRQDPAHGTWAFPRGLLARVEEGMKVLGYAVEWVPQARSQPAGDRRLFAELLNDHQRYAAELMVHHDHGVFWLFPRFGKTYVTAAAWLALGRPKAAILVGRQDIVAQTAEEMSQFLGEPVGWVCSGVGPDNPQQYTIVSPSTICSPQGIKPGYQPWLAELEMVVLDECHLAAQMVRSINLATQKRRRQYALSATPYVLDDPIKTMDLEAWFGPLRVKVDSKKGAELGLIAAARVRWYALAFSYEARCLMADQNLHWSQKYRAAVTTNTAFVHLLASLAHYHITQGDRVVVFVNEVAHGNAVADLVPDAVNLCGSRTKSEKTKAKERFNSGEIRCVVVTKRWREGITLPGCTVIINGAGMKAPHVQEQSYGRGLMLKEDRRDLLVIDFFFHDGAVMERHSQQRHDHYSDQGWVMEMTEHVTEVKEISYE